MSSKLDIKYLCFLIFLICIGKAELALSQLEVRAGRTDATYEAGEPMYFEVISDTGGEVYYNIRFDPKMPRVASGKITVNPGVPAKIPFVSEEPGSVLCRVTKDGYSVVGGAVFSKYDIQPYADEPADFDAFWDSVKAELAAVPMDPVLTLHDSTMWSTTYRINLGNINNRRVYGYISIPKDIPPPYPAILTLPPFGNIANVTINQSIISDWGGAISMSINIHNAEPDAIDPNAYLPNDISDRDGIYYKNAIAGAIRAIDYIFSRSDFNGVDMGVAGLSQGGGLALMTAGVDQRVTSLTQTVSALCGHAGHRFDRPSGLPLYVRDSRGTFGTIEHEDSTFLAARYYDGIYFSKRFKGPSLSFVSYADTISPLETIFAATNQFRENEVMKHSIPLGHNNPTDFWDVRFRFWRKAHPAMLNNPFPWTPSTTGYHADAGDDISISSGGTANLSATVVFNTDALSDLKARWIKIEGPGKVTFSNSTAYSTTATFSEDGEYILRFVATDDPDINVDGSFYTISDFVKVTVGD